MPLVEFDTLPDTARVWVFGSLTPVPDAAEHALLGVTDEFLTRWKAHGAPLTVGRTWRERRFLTIAVDTSAEHASGCSIDGLFRELQRIDAEFGTSLVGGGRVFYRDAAGAVQGVERGDVSTRIAAGEVSADTPVFDLTVPTLGEWRQRFETPAHASWIGKLVGAR